MCAPILEQCQPRFRVLASEGRLMTSACGSTGELTWTVGEAGIDVAPRQSLCISWRPIHRLDNHGTQDVNQLCVISPAML